MSKKANSEDVDQELFLCSGHSLLMWSYWRTHTYPQNRRIITIVRPHIIHKDPQELQQKICLCSLDCFAGNPGQRGLQGNKVPLLLAKLAVQPEVSAIEEEEEVVVVVVVAAAAAAAVMEAPI